MSVRRYFSRLLAALRNREVPRPPSETILIPLSVGTSIYVQAVEMWVYDPQGTPPPWVTELMLTGQLVVATKGPFGAIPSTVILNDLWRVPVIDAPVLYRYTTNPDVGVGLRSASAFFRTFVPSDTVSGPVRGSIEPPVLTASLPQKTPEKPVVA